MYPTIKEITSSLFSRHASFGDKCLAGLMIVMALLVVICVGLLGYIIADSAWLSPTKTTVTEVTEKHIVPPYTSSILVGEVVVPQYHPETYRLGFVIEDSGLSESVEKNLFYTTSIGDNIEVDYAYGRLSGWLKVKDIRRTNK